MREKVQQDPHGGWAHLAVIVECFGHCAREQLGERAERRRVQEEHLLSNEDSDVVFSLSHEETREPHRSPHQGHLDDRGGVAGEVCFEVPCIVEVSGGIGRVESSRTGSTYPDSRRSR